MDDASDDAHTFDLWTLPGRKTLSHDGVDLRIRIGIGASVFYFSVDRPLTRGQRYGFALAADPHAECRVKAVTRFLKLMRSPCAPRRSFTLIQPTRPALNHMRALQALDGELAGASQREIAGVIFGEAMTALQWTSDSALRAQVRALSHQGRSLMNGGYRSLLPHNKKDAQGGME